MKSNKYHTVEAAPKCNTNIVERGHIDILTHKYMIVYFPGYRDINEKVSSVMDPKPPFFVK